MVNRMKNESMHDRTSIFVVVTVLGKKTVLLGEVSLRQMDGIVPSVGTWP